MEIKFIVTIIIALLNIFLGIFILQKNYKNPGNLNFALMCVSGGLWAMLMAFLYFIDNNQLLIYALKGTYAFAILVPLFYLLFAYHYPYRLWNYPPWLTKAMVAVPIALAVCFISGLLNFQDFFIMFGLYFFAYVLWGLVILFKKLRSIEGIYRINLKYLIAGTMTSFIITGAVSIILPLFGNFTYAWLGPIFILIPCVVASLLIFSEFIQNLISGVNFNKFQIALCGYFMALVVFWLILNLYIKTTVGFYNYLFSFAFSLVPFLVGFLNIFIAPSWGWFKSSIGRAVFFISFGSFIWGFGSMIWSYYNFFENISAPYPSLADAGFFLAYFFWIIGIVNLFYASGASVVIRQTGRKYILVVIPTVVTAISYYLLVNIARGGGISNSINDHLKLFLDLAYPTGDVIILSVVLIIFCLPAAYLSGKNKLVIFLLLLGFFVMYFGDFAFSYNTTMGKFYNGHYEDFLFAIGLFLISLGCLGFKLEKRNDNA